MDDYMSTTRCLNVQALFPSRLEKLIESRSDELKNIMEQHQVLKWHWDFGLTSFLFGQVLCLSDDWYTMMVMILFSYCLSWDQNFWPWRRWKSRLGSCTISALDVLDCFGVCLLLNSDNIIYIYTCVFVLVWFPFNESLYQYYIYSVEVAHVFPQYHCGSLQHTFTAAQPPEDHEPGWWWDETSKGQVGGAIFSCDEMGEGKIGSRGWI